MIQMGEDMPAPFSREFFRLLVKNYEDSQVPNALIHIQRQAMENAKKGFTSYTFYLKSHEWYLTNAQAKELVRRLHAECHDVDIELIENADPSTTGDKVYKAIQLNW